MPTSKKFTENNRLCCHQIDLEPLLNPVLFNTKDELLDDKDARLKLCTNPWETKGGLNKSGFSFDNVKDSPEKFE
jgi:hypothetical protein